MYSEVATYKQRSDLTFKYNSELGRHGWLRLTPAYSVKLVNQILERKDSGISVLDPFSGTGTTPLCAAYKGLSSVSIDINPFLVWVGQVKTGIYNEEEIRELREKAKIIIKSMDSKSLIRPPLPPIHNIERWWGCFELTYLSYLKSAIETILPNKSKSKNLLLVSFSRLLIKLSNAAFNHQSLSFRENNSKQFDLLITSPPYPNRISYIREFSFLRYFDPCGTTLQGYA
ncbi:MAG: hypothetical protein ACE5I1_10165 [bacterium]